MKLEINLENCYGIGKLKEDLDFSETNIYLLYAQNGTFKTSFAKTLKDRSSSKPQNPVDKIFQNRISKAEVKFNNNDISLDNTIVFNSYDETFDSEKSIATFFLASDGLKGRYDEIFKQLDQAKKNLLKNLKSKSGSSDCEKEICAIFLNRNFYEILDRNFLEIQQIKEEFNFKYHDIFDKNGKVKLFLNEHKTMLEKYFQKYNELLEDSKIFAKTDIGSFGTHQANKLKEALGDGRFFKANHKIVIDSQEVTNSEHLKKIFEEEIEKLLQDEELKKIFETIDKGLNANEELRGFKEAISQDNLLLIKLANYDDFKKEVIFSYLNWSIKEVENLVELYRENKGEIQAIIDQAKNEQEEWKKIIETFNSRFFVPFRVEIKNQEDVLLKQESANLSFVFDDGEEMGIAKKELQQCLSQGEKRALYILQILFEIEARKKRKEEQLLIFDDIADSFDYRNKYAVIEYLSDLAKREEDEEKKFNFKIIVMTHNFDFYRTLNSRLEIDRNFTKMVYRDENRNISFKQGEYLKDFIKVVIEKQDPKNIIALIPFARNIIEYTKGVKDPDYINLTECLHIKGNTQNKTLTEIEQIFENIFKGNGFKKQNQSHKYLTYVYDIANRINKEKDPDPINLQNKIVLSIAIRLKAEEFMFEKIGPHQDFPKNQTRKLFELLNGGEGEEKITVNEEKILKKVLMITPENIHLNSFMYEPILDTSLDHLLKLYEDVSNL